VKRLLLIALLLSLAVVPLQPTSAAGEPRNEVTPVEPNLTLIGAPEAWARGVTGKGVVVALLDSGVDLTHPDLAARWRGGPNSWFDPYGEHPDAPIDLSGHGTQVLGVILGGGAGGSRIGVAPDAQWIAARVFDDRGRATTSAIRAALRWVLDPDGDPATDDAPQVINNSWASAGARCETEFAEDLRALRAAGILPVFAAGLSAPVSPSDSPEALAVGALAEDGATLYFDSARGPSACGDNVRTYPQIVAPGESIYTTDRFGLYTTDSGTSLAAAHVSGALALLLSADPALTAEEQQALLTKTAVDLGAPGADDLFGHGRVNVAAALDRVLGPGPAQASPTLPATSVPHNGDADAPPAALVASALAAMLVIVAAILRRRPAASA
jgi:subtilisin family serine protease